MVSKNYLESLLSKQATKNTGSKSQLESLVMYLGVKPKAHYARQFPCLLSKSDKHHFYFPLHTGVAIDI